MNFQHPFDLIIKKLIGIALFATLLAVAIPIDRACAQIGVPTSVSGGAPDGVGQVIEAARGAGVSIIILDGQTHAAVPSPALSMFDRAGRLAHIVSGNLHRILPDLRAAPLTLPAAMSPDGGGDPPFMALAVAVLSLGFGWLCERGMVKFTAARLKLPLPAAETPRTQWIRHILLKALIRGAFLAVGLVLALLAAVVVVGEEDYSMAVVLSAFEATVYVRALLLFFGALLTPSLPRSPILGISQVVAKRIYGGLRVGTWGAGALAAVGIWCGRIDAAYGVRAVLETAITMLITAVLGRFVWALHRAMTEADDDRVAPRSWLSQHWHLAAGAYLLLSALATIIDFLAGAVSRKMVIAPVLAAILASALYSVALLAIDAIFDAPETPEAPPGRSFRDWAERSALLAALGVAAISVLDAWGAGVWRETGGIRPIYTIMIISIAAYIGWSAVRTGFDRLIAREKAAAGPVHEHGVGGLAGSRLDTLLPLFRNTILIAILVFVAMVALSAIGLDVAPLFAGAGLIGIAVGFGAQTLVRDVFSGVFFLIDDAFRLGEYVDTGTVKGAVENISIRSVQLRHHNGPLHTVPFGEISQITNYSRDWVIMKLPIRVRFGTDTEQVRKLIKKLGVELLSHPEIGKKFVDPLKSQGVYQMDESGIVTRVKFKTKPGDQFAVRKVVYQKINELFEREGIAFGGREVVVRSAEEGSREGHGNHENDTGAVSQAVGAGADDAMSRREPA